MKLSIYSRTATAAFSSAIGGPRPVKHRARSLLGQSFLCTHQKCGSSFWNLSFPRFSLTGRIVSIFIRNLHTEVLALLFVPRRGLQPTSFQNDTACFL